MAASNALSKSRSLSHFQQEDPFPKRRVAAQCLETARFLGPALRHALGNGPSDIRRCRTKPSVLRRDLLIALATLRGVEIHAAENHGQRRTVDFDGQ